MAPEQSAIVKLTFMRVLHIREQAGKIFYDRLFEIAPDTRAMFKGDMDAQARKLMDTLATAISSLNDKQVLADMLDGLGRRHATYGVSDEHYDKVREALLWTLQRVLGDAFTSAAHDAWAVLYTDVATAMKRAAARTPRAVA